MRVLWLAAGALAMPIAARAYLGTFSRFTVDDYCWPARLARYGFISLQVDAYERAFGRWTSTALLSTFAYADMTLVSILPAVALMLWLAALTWLGYELTHRLPLALVTAELVILTTLAGALDAIQPVYWQTGMLTYMPPLIIAPAGAAVVLRWRSMVVAAALPFVAAGFNETYMAMQAIILALVAWRVPRYRPLTIGALIGAVMGALVVAAAPGNAIRHGDYGPPLLAVPLITALATGYLIAVVLAKPTTWLAFIAAMLLAHRFAPANMRLPRPVHLLALLLIVVAAAVAPGAYGLGTLPERSALAPTLAIIAFVLALGIWFGLDLRHRALPSFAFPTCAVLFAALATWQTFAHLPSFQRYASAWEQQDRMLRAAATDGESSVIVPLAANPFGLEDVGQPGSRWATSCALEYYGLDSIVAVPDSLTSR